jgi:integrase
MARQGTRTSHPGILRIDSNTFVIRVTARHPTTKKRLEKEETFAGKLDDARRRQLELLDELKQQTTQTTSQHTSQHTSQTTPQTSAPGILEPARRTETAMTLGVFAQQWVVHIVEKGVVRPAYVETRTHYLEGLVLPKLGNVQVDAIDEMQLEQWSVWLARQRKADGKPYAQNTLLSVWGLLRSMLRAARSLIGVRVEAVADFRFRVGGAPAREKDRLSAEELRKLLDVIAQEADVAWAAQLWAQAVTGMRHSEVTALHVGDVDLKQGFLSIRRSQVNGDVGEPKTRRSRRDLPLPPEFVALLARHIGQLDVKNPAATPLFPANNGRYRCVSATNKKIRQMCELARIQKNITSHAFRRSLNDLIRRTAGEVTARSILGHSRAEMTHLYSHVDLDEKAEAQRRALGTLPDPVARAGTVGMAGGDTRPAVGMSVEN